MPDIDLPTPEPADIDDDGPPAPPPAGFLTEARRVPVAEALRTIPDTLAVLLRRFWLYMGMAATVIAVYLIAAVVLSLLFGSIPVLDVLVLQVALPAGVILLFYGWYRVMGECETTGESRFSHLFAGFLENPLPIAGSVLLIWFSTALIFFLVFLALLFAVAPNALGAGSAVNPVGPLMRVGFGAGLVMLLASIALSPLFTIQGLFLAATAIGRMQVVPAIKASVRAALRNWLPIVAVCALFMVVATVVALVFGVVIGGIAGLLRSTAAAMLIALPAMVVAVALIPAFGYALFHRLFFPTPAAELEAEVPTRIPAPALPVESYAPPAVDRHAPWTLALLRALHPLRFGALCEAYFAAAGFHVEARNGLADGSARFTLASAARPEQALMLVETVAWGSAADLARLRNFKEGLVRADIPRGIMVAASGFTEDALKDAAASKLRAIDGAELLTLVLKLAPAKQDALRDAAFPPASGGPAA